MKLENIYKELKENISDPVKLLNLLDKMEEQIRLETSFKTSPKIRVNAIKRVASKQDFRPALTGYAIQNGYKIVTDSYHAIAIKQEEMPLPLVATKEELEKLGINLDEYRQKYGRNSVLNYTYPNLEKTMFEFNKDNEIQIDLDDIEVFYKTHKDKKELYTINGSTYRIGYLKNLIDILGKDIKVYYTGELSPLYLVNQYDEVGLVLPCKTY